MLSSRQTGFTLVEIAIVLLIVTILLGYTVAMFPLQQELKQYRKLDSEMDDIIGHLIGFAQVNGRLPCPDTTGDANGLGAGVLDGAEDTDDRFDNVDSTAADGIIDACKAYSGFIPTSTLGINGNIDQNGNLLDPWGQPYRYIVSDLDQDFDAVPASFAGIDLVTPNGIREEGLSNIVPLLFVCNDSDNASAADDDCADVSATNVAANVAVVIVSSGKDRGQAASNIQDENRDDFHDGTNDHVYTSSTRNDTAANLYDDRVRWISHNVLFAKMIEAGRLP